MLKCQNAEFSFFIQRRIAVRILKCQNAEISFFNPAENRRPYYTEVSECGILEFWTFGGGSYEYD